MNNNENKNMFLRSLMLAGMLPLCAASVSAQDAAVADNPPAPQNAPAPVVPAAPAAPADEVVARYSYLGLVLDTLPAATYCENSQPGIQVIHVVKDSPAECAGFEGGDILVSLDGQKLFFPNQFSALVRSYKPGTEVELVFLRGGEKMTKKVAVGERLITSPQVAHRARTEPAQVKDDVRLYINGREISLADGADLGGWISLTPNGVLIRDRLDIPAEFRRLVNRAHAKMPETQKMLSFLRRQYDDARKAALGKASQTFSQVFFGQGNSVIIVGNEKGRQVTVSRSGDDDILFRGPCTTQADIDAIPADAKKIIESFTVLKPMPEEELVTDQAPAAE